MTVMTEDEQGAEHYANTQTSETSGLIPMIGRTFYPPAHPTESIYLGPLVDSYQDVKKL